MPNDDEMVQLGGMTVPRLGLGTMWFGTRVPPDRAQQILDHAIDAGATFIDTANNYAFWDQPGRTGDESENVIGDWLTRRGSAVRDRIVLATKIGARPRPGAPGERLGLTADAITEQMEGSLRRLRVDHVDLLYAHLDDRDTDLAETVQALQDLVKQGKTKAIAGSNLTADRLRLALDLAGDGPGYCAVQNRFSFLPPRTGTDFGVQVLLSPGVQEVAASAGVTMIAYSLLLEGAYTRPEKPLPPAYGERAGVEDRLAVLGQVASAVGLDAGQTVMAWMVNREPQVLPLAGVSRPEQVDEALEAVRTPIPAQLLARLEAAAAG